MNSRFKILAVLSSAALAMLASCAGKDSSRIAATDPCVTWTGRILDESDGSASYDWSGVTARVRFEGTCLNMDFADTGKDYFNVWIDGEPSAGEDYVIVAEGEGSLKIASGLSAGEHIAVIQKRTEGEQGMMTVKSFATDGRFLQAGGRHKRSLEFIGDSYTCGFGTEGSASDLFEAATENCNLAYAAIIGRFFDADIQTICHSGRGLVRNYDDGDSPVMTQRYRKMFDEYKSPVCYDPKHAGFKPDAVIIYLGTNDFSCGKHPSQEEWCSGFNTLLSTIRGYYGPQVPVLCVSSRADRLLADFVEAGVKLCGDPCVFWTSIENEIHDDASDLGAVSHPNYSGHRKVASHMIPYISTVTGWEMPYKPIE